MSAERNYPLRVPTNPSNPFNDPYNVGLLGGTCAGLLFGYVMGGHILPYTKKWLTTVFTGQCKMALVVNSELQMSRGKIASQCSHAAVMSYKYLDSPLRLHAKRRSLLMAWEMTGQAKIVLRAPNFAAMEKLEKIAKEKKVVVQQVFDEGRTEVPHGSCTVMAIGPGPINLIDEITGDLRLL